MHKDMESVLISKEEIKNRIKEISAQLNKDYENQDVVMICVLKGSVNFFADLVKELEFNAIYDFMVVSSYGAGVESTGFINIKKDLSEDISGKHVIIVEDIIDSGNTLFYLRTLLTERNAASVKIVTLLDKPDRREKPIDPDYVGFVIPNKFVVGYGLDYNEKYRNLPEVYVLSPKVYS